MHCHLAHHQSDGMNLVMQEGEIQEMAPLPPNFPTCNNFRVNPNQFLSSLKNQERINALVKRLIYSTFSFPLSLLYVFGFDLGETSMLQMKNNSIVERNIYCQIELHTHTFIPYSVTIE